MAKQYATPYPPNNKVVQPPKDPTLKTVPSGDAGINEFALNTNRTVEFLPELQGRTGSLKYRQMSNSDGLLGMSLRACKNPISSCEWGIKVPDKVTPQEQKAIDILNRAMFGESVDNSFLALLGKVLSFLEYGFSLFNLYYKPYQMPGDKAIYLVPVLEQRVQTSIQDVWPQVRIVRQMTITEGMLEISFDDLVFFIIDQQGDDMRGRSIFRNAYRAWKHKNAYEEWMGIGVQRSTAGIPSMTVPKGVRVDSEDYLAAEQLLKNITFHENAYMILPEGWTLEMFESKFDTEKVQKAIDSKNSEMALSTLTQFLLLGSVRSSGSFALSNDQSGFFLDGLQYVVTLIENIFNAQVIAPFLKLNFGDAIDPERVKLQGLNLNKKAAEALAAMLLQLSQSGFLKATVDDEVQLREYYDLPALNDKVLAKRQENELKSPPSPTLNPGAGGFPFNQPAPQPQPGEQDNDPEDLKGHKHKHSRMIGKNKAVKLSEGQTNRRKVRSEHVEKSIKECQDFMKANLLLMKDKLMADVEATLNRGQTEIQGLKQIQVSSAKYQKGLERKLAGIAIESWNLAKAGSKKAAVKLAEDQDPKEISSNSLKQFVLNNATVTSDNQAQQILSRAILVASNGPLKGLSNPQTMSNVGNAIDDYIDSNAVDVAGSLIAVGTSVFGAQDFYDAIEDEIWGYQFCNDDPISEICQWYDGKTFSVDSPEMSMATPPLHPNCKSFLDPIYKSEMDQDDPQGQQAEIDDVIAPPSIQKDRTIY